MIITQVETELAAISQQLRSATVEISNQYSGGSGIIWSSNGLVVTNSHVVRGSKSRIKLGNGRVVEGSVIARDPQQDLAVIQMHIEKGENLSTPTIGNAQLLRPGEIVLAMGSPYGFSGALTMGIIHVSVEREFEKTKLNWTQKKALNLSYPNALIVADIRLAPGNSGGILANARGEVIGINVAIVSGLALAIPSQQVENFIETITR
ncbi:MAG: trypsin-like peptidase domain-containing protein [Pleurocapsa sp. MO_192.B19]|nr:trypsin-like peptidase domain-containing protein [Pleurocapsa sp. MO_192.B19]